MCGMALLSGDAQRLADRVAARRGELGLTHREMQFAGGPSPATMSLIEGAGRDSLQVGIAGKLEKALQWAPGSVRAILAGGEPTLTTAFAGAASGSATAYDARVHAVRDERVLILLDQRRAGRPVEELAAAAGMDVARWRDIIAGVVYPAPASELARMGRVLGVSSGEIRRAGHTDAANALQDMDLDEKYGHKTSEELDAESMEILKGIRAAIEKDRARMDDTDQLIVDQQASGLAKTVAALRRRRRDAS